MSIIPFDDRDGFIWLDGKLVPWREAKIHVLTHGLHYGSAVFEGERAYSGRIFKAHEHNDRFFRSAEILDMKIPFSKEELIQARHEVLKANNLTDCYMRPLAWRGAEIMGIAAQNATIHVMIAAWVWQSYFSPEKAAKGLDLKLSKWKRPSPETAPIQSKAAGGYMIGTLARHEAMAAGFDDAILLDHKDRVAEGTGANLFMIKDGKIVTPPPECALNGITRLTVINLAREMGYEAVENFFSYEELLQADEIFLTGTAAELQPVGRIDGCSFPVGPITKTLQAAYKELVHKG